jgi:S1-C subfamily serine protease
VYVRYWIGVGVGLAVACWRVAAFSAPDGLSAALDSVVTVLPERPGYQRSAEPSGLRALELSGSGVAIRRGGYIATSAHVIDAARAVHVRLADGRELPASVVGRDAATDLALLRVEAELPALAMGPEPALGARVCAIADPFGVGLSVTCGVVSAVRRSGMGFNPIEDFIQTDAVLNPGASGGALVDGKGRLVGLVSAIFTRKSDANIGINFAASAALLRRVIEDLIAHGAVRRGDPGLRLAPLSRAERRSLAGVRILGLAPGGAGEKAGLRAGDILTHLAGRTLRKRSDVAAAIALQPIGRPFEVAYMRDGKRRTTRMTLTLPR